VFGRRRRKEVALEDAYKEGHNAGYIQGYDAGRASTSGLRIRLTTLEAVVERQAKSIQKLFTKGAGRRLFTAKQE